MLTTIVPLFQGIFQQQGVDIPWITQWIIKLANGIQSHGLLLFLGVFGLLLVGRQLYKKPSTKQALQSFFFGLPIIGNQLQINYSFKFSQSMHLLTQSRVNLVQCLSLLQEMHAFYPLQNALAKMSQSLAREMDLGNR